MKIRVSVWSYFGWEAVKYVAELKYLWPLSDKLGTYEIRYCRKGVCEREVVDVIV